jgi:hypothetical protein
LFVGQQTGELRRAFRKNTKELHATNRRADEISARSRKKIHV